MMEIYVSLYTPCFEKTKQIEIFIMEVNTKGSDKIYKYDQVKTYDQEHFIHSFLQILINQFGVWLVSKCVENLL